MAFLKFTADSIFTGHALLGKGQVLITNEKGFIEDIVANEEAGDNIQHHTGILCPGFINTHCHLELSHMRGVVPEKTGLVDFVMTVMRQRNFAEDVMLAAIAQSETEMIENGIVAVGDICNTTLTLAQKQKHNLRYYNFIEATGFVPAAAEARFQQAENIYNQFKSNSESGVAINQSAQYSRLAVGDSRFSSIVPHAPYSTSLALMQLINNHSAGKTISIHNQETPEEDSFFITGQSNFRKLFQAFNIDISFYQPTGKSSLQTYLPYLNKAKSLILVHNTCTTEQDILQTINAKLQTFFCLCPNANLYIENMLPPVELIRKNSANITIGTDSLASNHGLSVLEELNTLQEHFPNIPVEELLSWATINGARALSLDDLLGSFDKGKRPGVLTISPNFSNVKRVI